MSGFLDPAAAPRTLSAEVCIVGSGAGGAVSAAVLAAAGLDVLVLEEGGHHTRPEFRMREDTAFPMLYQEDGGRATKDQAIAILQGRSVGGSTTINWTTSFRTPERVVDHWSKVHAVNGFKYADLVPHWEAVERRLNIAPILLEEINANNRTLWDGCKKLGYEVALVHRNVRSCLKSGYCGMGCPVDAKQSMLITYIPEAVASGARVLPQCRVDRVSMQPTGWSLDGTLLGTDGVTPSGEVKIAAKYVILAGGAINTPAILLRSGIKQNGLVGRRTFLHPTIAQLGIYNEAIQGFYGAPQAVSSHHFVDRGPEVGYFLETAPVHPMLAAMACPGIGEAHRGVMAALSRATAHIALTVDGFHPDVPGGTVELRKSGAPVVNYPIPDRLWRAMRDAAKTLARVQLASGAVESRTTHDPPAAIRTDADIAKIDSRPFGPNQLAVFSAHCMGGCAMGDEPDRSVVRSEDLQLQGVKDLHIIDGSVFPTSLGVNPQLSIYGLAHLIATRLASKWKKA